MPSLVAKGEAVVLENTVPLKTGPYNGKNMCVTRSTLLLLLPRVCTAGNLSAPIGIAQYYF